MSKVIQALLTLAFFLPLFSTFPGLELPSQLGAIAILCACATLSMLYTRNTPTLFGVAGKVLILTGTISFVVSGATNFTYGLVYSVLFSVTVIAAEIITSRLSLKTVYYCVCNTYLLMIAAIIMVYPSDFLEGVRGTTERGVGLVRFEPFELHPNLTGFIFAAGFIALSFRAYSSNNFMGKVIFAIGAMLSASIVLAASARGSLLASGIALLIYLPLFTRKNGRNLYKYWPIIPVASVAGIAFLVLFHNQFIDYLSVILDLDNEQRGLDSGGTGRFELWQAGLDFIFSQALGLLVGNGFRSASPELIGFSTESSYITIAIENGIPVCVLIVGCLLIAIRNQHRISRISSPCSPTDAVFVLLVFAMLQSVFNRYLMAIGNTYSLYIIFMFVAAWKIDVKLLERQRVPAPAALFSTSQSRQIYLSQRVGTVGHFRAADLCQIYGISVTQARRDLRSWLLQHEVDVHYNNGKMRYERNEPHRHEPEVNIAGRLDGLNG